MALAMGPPNCTSPVPKGSFGNHAGAVSTAILASSGTDKAAPVTTITFGQTFCPTVGTEGLLVASTTREALIRSSRKAAGSL